jgi:hypothetical protein
MIVMIDGWVQGIFVSGKPVFLTAFQGHSCRFGASCGGLADLK